MGLREWWKRYKANLPYTRKELKVIHKDALRKGVVSDSDYVWLEVSVWDKIIRDYRSVILETWFWVLMVGALALLILWRG